MKVPSIKNSTPVKKTLAMVKKATKQVDVKPKSYIGRDIEPAIANLERRAENLSPDEYINARRYLANAEMNYFYRNELSEL